MSARVATLSTIVAALVWAAVSVTTLVAQTSVAQFSISGTSTVRSWTCTAKSALEIEPGNSGDPVPGFSNGVAGATIVVAVAEIVCPEEDMMEHLQEAMEEPEYPEISYRLEEYTFKSDDTAEASGTMTIHGTSQPITFDIRLESKGDGVRGVGETSIDMTEFGVEPPSVWLGMLNVGEVVTIKFDALLPAAQ